MFDSLPLGSCSSGAPPPPPPSSGVGGSSQFKMVTGLGEALHQAKLKLTGVKETPACAEGVSAGPSRQVSMTPSPRVAGTRPRSWHAGAAGKNDKNRAVISEMQHKLAARRAKVDREAEVKISNEDAPSPTPQDDYKAFGGNRKYSQESLDSCGSYIREPSMTPSIDGYSSSYRRKSVDAERKEELLLAKQVRQNSVKILRQSPLLDNPMDGQTCNNNRQGIDFSAPLAEVPPPSSVVLRYWNQCASPTVETNGSDSTTTSGEDKTTEEEATSFPSIKDKIKDIETGKLVTCVPDVKEKLKLDDFKPAEWMETRKKLQAQLDVLLTRTTNKISNIATKSEETDGAIEEEPNKEDDTDSSEAIQTHTAVDQDVKTLIKSVASEIQKSFSQKNLDDVFYDAEEDLDNNSNEQDLTEETPIDNKPFEPELEAPVDFDSIPVVLDNSLNKAKLSAIRKCSVERRAPSSGKRAIGASRQNKTTAIKELLTELDDINDRASPLPKLLGLENDTTSEEQKAEYLAKEMAKLESSQVVNILQSIEKGILDCSVPLLIPFLSIQVKLAVSKDIFTDLPQESKKEVIRDSILESLLNDITDIAILQEVIDRSQEKLNKLGNENDKVKKDASTNTFDSYLLEKAKEQREMEEAEKAAKESSNTDVDNSTEDIENEIKEAIQQKEQEEEFKPKEETAEKSTKVKLTESSKCERSETPTPSDTTPNNEPDSSEDSGVDVEDNNKENDLAKSKSEKDIKHKILNILNDVKAQEESKKKTRNFGRNFEFQMPNLKPVIPNDKRPAKVRRMDDLWSRQVAARTGNWSMLEAPAPKPAQKVPWTKKKDPETTVKRESLLKNEEVEEFEKCRTALSEHKAGKKVSMVESPAKKKIEDQSKEEKSEKNNLEHNSKIANDNTDSIENKDKTEIEKEEQSKNKEVKESETEKENGNVNEKESSENKEKSAEKKSKCIEKQAIITESNETNKHSIEIESIKKEEVKIEVTENKTTDKDHNTAIKVTTDSIEEKVENKDKTENSPKSPIIPRRRDINPPASVLKVPPSPTLSRPPPPPPSRKPPPPPMSPPPMNETTTEKLLETTTARFQELQKEFSIDPSNYSKQPSRNIESSQKNDEVTKKSIEIVRSKSPSPAVLSESESEWEEWTEEEETDWESESEDEKEQVAKVAEEASETTYTAEFCIRL